MKLKYALLNESDLKAAAVPKGRFVSKRERGVALIIAGSAGYHGAPVLSSLAAYNTICAMRVGAGYARLYVPGSLVDPVRALSPNIIVRRLGETSITCNKQILDEVKRSDAVAIGMGIGSGTKAIVSAGKIIGHAAILGKAIVVDADAIPSLKGAALKNKLNSSVIATPHDGEFFRLTGNKVPRDDIDSRIDSAVQCAKEFGITLVLKGHYTIVTDGGKVKVNRARTSALATMGTGDVLSGIICGYAATGAKTFAAACAGVYLHSRIADSLYGRMGSHILAQDVAQAIPSIIKKFDKKVQ